MAATRVLVAENIGASGIDLLREHFEVNRHWVALHALKSLADAKQVPVKKVAEAIAKYKLDTEKPNPVAV